MTIAFPITVAVSLYSLCILMVDSSPLSKNRDLQPLGRQALTPVYYKAPPKAPAYTSPPKAPTYKAPPKAPAYTAPPKKPTYAGKGEYCGGSKYCSKGLTCYNAKCYGVMQYGGICGTPFMKCAGNLSCRAPAYGSGPKKCVSPRGKGAGCDEGYHFCQSGLTCALYGTSKRCLSFMKEGEDCSKTFMLCNKGLVCTHKSRYFRTCEKPRAAKGAYCGASIKCADGLTCVGFGATAKCYGVMKYGGVCSGAFMTCASGLSCRAPAYGSGPKKCVSPRGKGAGCDEGYHFCGGDLSCAQYGEHKRCVGFMGQGGDCSKTFMLCNKGLVCTHKSRYVRQCEKPRANKGEYCSSSLQCAAGLTCLGSGSSAKCYGVMKFGGVCDGAFMKCEAYLTCRGPVYGTGPKKCVSPRDRGNGCGSGYNFCKSGLDCIKWGNAKRCVGLVDVYGNCSKIFSLCKGGAKCVGPAGKRTCIVPKPVVKPVYPAKPVKPAQPVKPVYPAKPVQPVKPAYPAKPVKLLY